MLLNYECPGADIFIHPCLNPVNMNPIFEHKYSGAEIITIYLSLNRVSDMNALIQMR